MEYDYVYINNLFNKCLFSTKDLMFSNLYFLKNRLEVTGISMKVYFNKIKLEKYKDDIKRLISMIPNIDDGVSFNDFPYDNVGKKKVGHYSCEKLMCLGLAIGELEYSYPKDMWNSLPNGMPVLNRVKKQELKLVKSN